MAMKTLLILLPVIAVVPSLSQNINFKLNNAALYHLPLRSPTLDRLTLDSGVERRDYIIGKENDTLQVHFFVPSLGAMPFGDSVWISEKAAIIKNGKIRELVPGHLTGLSYKGAYYESVRWVDSVGGQPWTITHRFCKQILSGVIPVFACHLVTEDDDGNKRLSPDLYYKEDEHYKRVMFMNTDKAASRLVSSCPELSDKMNKGNCTAEDFLTIVKTYNKYFEPKTSN